MVLIWKSSSEQLRWHISSDFPLNGGLAHYVNAGGKMMSSRLWVASRARAIRDHCDSQTESGRPFLFTFPFEKLKSCCVLGCFSGAGLDRTISFHRLPPINRPRLTKVLHNLRADRVWSKHFVGVREGSLDVPSFLPLLKTTATSTYFQEKRTGAWHMKRPTPAQTATESRLYSLGSFL